jgi:cyclopropane fatty-acyl-phospholipid synthase-like methyltransferase
MEITPLDVPAAVAKPAAYQGTGRRLGEYLESYGHIITRLEAEPGMRMLELGCGDSGISLHLARCGCEIVGLDIELLTWRSFNRKRSDSGSRSRPSAAVS